MRHPERKRNAALALCLAGPVLVIVALAIPDASLRDGPRGTLFAIGFMLFLFAGTVALVLHQSVKRKRQLERGEGVLARWRIPSQAWQAFLALDAERNARGDRARNEFEASTDEPRRDVDVIVGKDAVEIDGSLHALPRNATPQITRAEFDGGGNAPGVIELDLLYPGDGVSADGTLQGRRTTLLRFPAPAGAAAEAQAIVAFYLQPGPGEAGFLHGPGDGSDPEDLCVCWKCGFETYRVVALCEKCGATMLSRRWTRRYGVILVVLGLLLAGGGVVLLANMLPMLLHPGEQIGGSSFNGSRGMANSVILILGGVMVFGFASLGYGIFQAVTGRRSWAVMRIMFAIVGALYVLGFVLRAGWV